MRLRTLGCSAAMATSEPSSRTPAPCGISPLSPTCGCEKSSEGSRQSARSPRRRSEERRVGERGERGGRRRIERDGGGHMGERRRARKAKRGEGESWEGIDVEGEEG